MSINSVCGATLQTFPNSLISIMLKLFARYTSIGVINTLIHWVVFAVCLCIFNHKRISRNSHCSFLNRSIRNHLPQVSAMLSMYRLSELYLKTEYESESVFETRYCNRDLESLYNTICISLIFFGLKHE